MPIPPNLTLEIVTPDRLLLREKVDEVEIPAVDGYIGVLPGHTPLLATLQVGEMWYRTGAERHFLSLAFGFAEVLPDRVTILAQIAEKADEIDVERAETERKRAQAALASAKTDMDLDRARASMMKALVRLQVAARARTRG
jgi:F-type H+-transporting ATPase subunit epsilon